MRGVVPLLPDVVGLFVQGGRVEFAEVSQQVLEDYFVSKVCILQLFEFEFHKNCFFSMLWISYLFLALAMKFISLHNTFFGVTNRLANLLLRLNLRYFRYRFRASLHLLEPPIILGMNFIFWSTQWAAREFFRCLNFLVYFWVISGKIHLHRVMNFLWAMNMLLTQIWRKHVNTQFWRWNLGSHPGHVEFITTHLADF